MYLSIYNVSKINYLIVLVIHIIIWDVILIPKLFSTFVHDLHNRKIEGQVIP